MNDVSPQPLPAGPRGLDPAHVAASQRGRLLEALTSLCAESGIESVRIGDITSRARTAKRTFYAHFTDLQDCFVAAYDQIDDAVFAALAAGAAPYSAPFPRIAHALTGLLDHLATNPAAANLWVLESRVAGPRAAERRMQTSRQLADLYLALHAEVSEHWQPMTPMSRVRAFSVVGAVDLPVSAALREDGAAALPGMAAELGRAVYLLVYGTLPPPE